MTPTVADRTPSESISWDLTIHINTLNIINDIKDDLFTVGGSLGKFLHIAWLTELPQRFGKLKIKL